MSKYRENIEIEKEMAKLSRCPACGSNTLKRIKQPLARFECRNKWCRRFDTFDYISIALRNYGNHIDIEKIFKLCFEGVNL